MIPISNRELIKAWRELREASLTENRTNPHRLLLFYAAECGLKAVYLRENGADILDGEIANELRHDLNRVMDKLRIGKEYRLPTPLTLKPLRKAGTELHRSASCGDVNQIWRYGSNSTKPGDKVLEQALEKVNEWIAGELK